MNDELCAHQSSLGQGCTGRSGGASPRQLSLDYKIQSIHFAIALLLSYGMAIGQIRTSVRPAGKTCGRSSEHLAIGRCLP